MATLHRLRPLASIPAATTPTIFVRTAISSAIALKPREPVKGKQSKGRLLPEKQVRAGSSVKEIIKPKKDGEAIKDIVIFMDKEAKIEFRKAEQERKGTKGLTMRQAYNLKYPRAIPPVPEGHGKEIFIFAHIQTGRVIYSFTRVMDSLKAMKQLTFVGKKTVPRALRKDHWRPLAHVTFSKEQSGTQTFHYLREYRKMHETQYDPTLLKTTTRFERRKLLMNQRANSIADLAESLKKTDDERIEILWDDIYDAEYAPKWPANVLHDTMAGSSDGALGEGIKRGESSDNKITDASIAASAKNPHYILPGSEAKKEDIANFKPKTTYHLVKINQQSEGPITSFQHYSRMVKQTSTKIRVVQEEAAKGTEWAQKKVAAGYVAKLEKMKKLYQIGISISQKDTTKSLPESKLAKLEKLKEEISGKNWLPESQMAVEEAAEEADVEPKSS